MPRLAAAAAIAAAVTVPAGGQQVFRGGTDLVLLTITVVDGQNRLVAGLDQVDFQIYEDGVLQDPTNFSRQAQPIALSLVIDTSTSMDLKLPIAHEAAGGFIKRMGPKDVAQVIDFDNQAKILQTFTSDREALERAVGRMEAGGSTSLYNAVYTSLSELRRIRDQSGPDLRRQAIVLLSDGEDTSSIVPYEDVIDLAHRSEVVVYSIGIVDKDMQKNAGWNEADFVLRTLARETGGRAFSVMELKQLPNVYSQIADELANQYTVAYVSKNAKRDGAWRKINVQIARAGSTARTKAGYFGPKGAQ
ncbi:MAG TPA: VWA domain-containing protein [Vicinamibacterales bacterium]|nr:VWA domain-containing protein [Vicinamibacterales bacterium]